MKRKNGPRPLLRVRLRWKIGGEKEDQKEEKPAATLHLLVWGLENKGTSERNNTQRGGGKEMDSENNELKLGRRGRPARLIEVDGQENRTSCSGKRKAVHAWRIGVEAKHRAWGRSALVHKKRRGGESEIGSVTRRLVNRGERRTLCSLSKIGKR